MNHLNLPIAEEKTETKQVHGEMDCLPHRVITVCIGSAQERVLPQVEGWTWVLLPALKNSHFAK